MTSKFEKGVFTYKTAIMEKDSARMITVTLDLNHREIRNMILRAFVAKGSQSREAGGALVVRVR